MEDLVRWSLRSCVESTWRVPQVGKFGFTTTTGSWFILGETWWTSFDLGLVWRVSWFTLRGIGESDDSIRCSWSCTGSSPIPGAAKSLCSSLDGWKRKEAVGLWLRLRMEQWQLNYWHARFDSYRPFCWLINLVSYFLILFSWSSSYGWNSWSEIVSKNHLVQLLFVFASAACAGGANQQRAIWFGPAALHTCGDPSGSVLKHVQTIAELS